MKSLEKKNLVIKYVYIIKISEWERDIKFSPSRFFFIWGTRIRIKSGNSYVIAGVHTFVLRLVSKLYSCTDLPKYQWLIHKKYEGVGIIGGRKNFIS